MNFPKCHRHFVDIRLSAKQDGMMQDDDAVMGAAALVESAGGAIAACGAADVQGTKAFVQGDPFGTHSSQQTVPRQAERRAIVLHAKLVVTGRIGRILIAQESDAGKIAQPFLQALDILSAYGVTSIELVELGQEDGGLELGKGAELVAAIDP